ncbi:MAG: hypothetical protein NZ551_10520 [Microscillaceae bacterium]|nr:hypothetical protein [Microscillaceae bacterium]MDW8461632.1 hypothetical protein [Cytophagales bacterium]
MIEKDDSLIPISKVEIEPFTGAVIISKGINYKNLEIYVGENESDFLVNNKIANNSHVVFKIIQPKGFRKNKENDILFGLEFEIREEDKLLQKLEDPYKNKFMGINAELLKYLKFTISLDDLKENKDYQLWLRIFDKQSNAEITINLPFVTKPTTRISDFIKYSFGVLGQDIVSKNVGEIEIQRIEWRQAQEVVSKLRAAQPFDLWLEKVKKFQGRAQAQYAWINAANCERVIEKNIDIEKNEDNIRLSNLIAPQEAGRYIFWFKFEQEAPKYQNYAFTSEINVE